MEYYKLYKREKKINDVKEVQRQERHETKGFNILEGLSVKQMRLYLSKQIFDSNARGWTVILIFIIFILWPYVYKFILWKDKIIKSKILINLQKKSEHQTKDRLQLLWYHNLLFVEGCVQKIRIYKLPEGQNVYPCDLMCQFLFLEGRTQTRESNSEFTPRVSKLPTFPLLGF